MSAGKRVVRMLVAAALAGVQAQVQQVQQIRVAAGEVEGVQVAARTGARAS